MRSQPNAEVDTIAYLRSSEAIRERCGKLFALAQVDQLRYFRCDLTQLERVSDYVIAVTREHYPDLQIPFHSRWRHFEVGNVPRLEYLDRALTALSPLERAKAKFDLVIPSVLLDAGAGDRWHYLEAETGQVWSRSEGLAIASFDLFCQGGFSSDPANRYQTNADGLCWLTPNALAESFQVSDQNPLVGVEGRSQLLQKLGQALQTHPNWFGATNPRPGNLVNYLLQHVQDSKLSAPIVLSAILEGFGEIWSGRVSLAGVNLGDVWLHTALPGTEISDKLVPFHKLSQWLTYSLLEPLQELGLDIIDLDALTGLSEYRNGGLCLDLGLLQVKDQQVLQQSHLPGAEAIVEWRALTVCLLDAIAHTMRQRLNLSDSDLPLLRVLQGGTWAAGRKIAAHRRPGGAPPIYIESDGTVF